MNELLPFYLRDRGGMKMTFYLNLKRNLSRLRYKRCSLLKDRPDRDRWNE
jgi:hypothetical protein